MDRPTDRPWLLHYPKGVPHDIDTSQYGSLVELLDDAFRRHASRDAYYSLGKTMRYAEVDGRLEKFMTVVKVRGCAHSNDLRAYRITDARLEVDELPTEVVGVFSGGPARSPTAA